MFNEIKKVCLYIRVSTEEQATEGYSLSAQVNTLRQYAELQGWYVTNVYAEGISGKSIKGRPQLQQLLVDMQYGQFDGILVWKISRLSRSLYDTLTLLKRFEEFNVQFVSYSENFDTSTPIGRLVLQLMAGIAEMERNTLSDNVKLGMKQKALEGGWNGGSVLGYDSIDGELVINEKEAEVVRIIFTEYAQGKGLKAVANKLNKSGYKTKRGRLFSINGIAQILDNPMYIGKIRWMRMNDWNTKRRKGKNPNPIIVDGNHKAIISKDLWAIVQELRTNKSFKQKQSDEPFLLNALLRCPVCGQGMVPHITTYKRKDGTKRKHRYYECGDFHNKGTVACNANSVRAFEAEERVFSLIKNFIQNDEQIREKIQGINQNNSQHENAFQQEIDELNKRINELNDLQERYFHAFENKLFPLDMLQDRLRLVSEEKTAIEYKLNSLRGEITRSINKTISPQLIKELLQRFIIVYEDGTREQKKHLLQLLVKQINVALQPNGPLKRGVESIELEFDFLDQHNSKSIILIHHLFGDSKWSNLSIIDPNNRHLPPYLQKFLPLFMVRFPPHNPKSPINLLHQNQPHQLMGKCHLAKRQLIICSP